MSLSSAFRAFMTRHFGGVPTKIADLEWIYRTRPDIPPIVVSAKEFRDVAPGSQPDFQPPKNEAISKNYYFNRDARRSYPETAIYNTQDIHRVLVAGPTQARIAGGEAEEGGDVAQKSEDAYYPPLINNRHQWKPSMPHLVPDEVNPHLSIRGRT
ncbi:hypothetical protein HK101_006197 [Irineochytrium annulatum]|nr:hypothetical protein HK101_006197 [Irineochytrium annulatum]